MFRRFVLLRYFDEKYLLASERAESRVKVSGKISIRHSSAAGSSCLVRPKHTYIITGLVFVTGPVFRKREILTTPATCVQVFTH